MATFNSVEIFLEFEPIVKLVCHNIDCKHNLYNCAIDPGGKQLSCNLKQISIDKYGQCENFQPNKNP